MSYSDYFFDHKTVFDFSEFDVSQLDEYNKDVFSVCWLVNHFCEKYMQETKIDQIDFMVLIRTLKTCSITLERSCVGIDSMIDDVCEKKQKELQEAKQND